MDNTMETKKKTWDGIIFLISVLVVISALAWPILGTMIRNNIILIGYADQLYSLPLPGDTKVISQSKSVGNLGGNGNHLDFAAAMIVESRLSEKALLDYYGTKRIKSANEISGMKLDTVYPDMPVSHPDSEIEVIPMNQAGIGYMSTKIYYKVNKINSKVNRKLFIIQISDRHYAPGNDLRAH
ncbi:MAG: hypothetical protein ACM3PP_08515 [Candidatus Saccharibacteria bacterium]